jgi:hypothetical protein
MTFFDCVLSQKLPQNWYFEFDSLREPEIEAIHETLYFIMQINVQQGIVAIKKTGIEN